jgi:salicylate hydroxylase
MIAVRLGPHRQDDDVARPLDIVVIGGGIGGLSCAAQLLREGHQVRVLEQAPQLSEVGAGIQFSANSTRVLRELGVLPAYQALAVEPIEYRFRLHGSGELLQTIPLGSVHAQRHGAPYFLMHRADAQQILERAVADLRSDAIVLGARVQEVAEDASGVTVRCTDDRSFRADLVIGADGIHSMLRTRNLGALRARFTENVAWRCMVPASRLPAGFKDPVVEIWAGPRRHVVIYPLRGGEWINFVGIVEDAGWREESWTVKSRWEDLHAEFAAWHPGVSEVVAAVDRDQCFRWAMLDRPPAQGWSTARTTLLGDAAHPTLPLLAQGANMAIEDGAILVRCLALCERLQDALQMYQRNRYERTERVQTESAANVALFHNDSDEALRQMFARRKMDRERSSWLYNYDPLTVALS